MGSRRRGEKRFAGQWVSAEASLAATAEENGRLDCQVVKRWASRRVVRAACEATVGRGAEPLGGPRRRGRGA
jgi:hypothetical protein